MALIESGDLASPGPTDPRRQPSRYPVLFGSTEDWSFRTLPQPQLAGRALAWPRGRGMGGSTRINAMIWLAPRACDLRQLEHAAAKVWTGEHVTDHLLRVCRWVAPESARWVSASTERFLQAMRGHPVESFPRMTRQGRRRTAGDVLEESSAAGSQVRKICGSVDRVTMEHRRATGVMLTGSSTGTDGEVVRAQRGVILAAGAIGSPCVLMRSGIGPADDLHAATIDVAVESPLVGRQLSDHLLMPVIHAVPDSFRFPFRPSTQDMARWSVRATGPIASNLAEAGGHFLLDEGPSTGGDGSALDSRGCEFQVHFTPTHYLLHPQRVAPSAVTFGVNVAHPRSRGQLRIVCRDPNVAPEIDPRYLTEPSDLENLIRAVYRTRSLVQTTSQRGWLTRELLPGAGRCDNVAIGRCIARYSQTLYHPLGTCAMGGGAEAVVDPGGRVRGMENLYVMDGSVVPGPLSVNPNATIMALASLLAERLDA